MLSPLFCYMSLIQKYILDANFGFYVGGPGLLPGFNIITTVHGLKSFWNGIYSSPFTDFKHMFCTLKRMMAAQ